MVDASGKLVFPGFIDAHTHFQMNAGQPNETADSFETGTRAAVVGGTTTILDFATQDRGDTLPHALEVWHSRADGHCACNYGFHMAITDWNPRTRADMKAMTEAGVTSYKVYLAYDALRLPDRDVYEILRAALEEGALVSAHCENGDLVNAGIAAQKSWGSCLRRSSPVPPRLRGGGGGGPLPHHGRVRRRAGLRGPPVHPTGAPDRPGRPGAGTGGLFGDLPSILVVE